jgi:predicted  nucleic acid-binding Zn-ribbon protein
MVEPSEPGVRKCQKCGWLFVSPDPLRVGRCSDCKGREDQYANKTGRKKTGRPRPDGFVKGPGNESG